MTLLACTRVACLPYPTTSPPSLHMYGGAREENCGRYGAGAQKIKQMLHSFAADVRVDFATPACSFCPIAKTVC